MPAFWPICWFLGLFHLSWLIFELSFPFVLVIASSSFISIFGDNNWGIISIFDAFPLLVPLGIIIDIFVAVSSFGTHWSLCFFVLAWLPKTFLPPFVSIWRLIHLGANARNLP